MEQKENDQDTGLDIVQEAQGQEENQEPEITYANQPNQPDQINSNVVGFFGTLKFWPAVLIGFLFTVANLAYGLGVVLFLLFLVLIINKKNSSGAKGLVLGFFSVFIILFLACGTCFLNGGFF